MDLGLNEDQEMLKSMAREFLEKESPRAFVREMEDDDRGFTNELWRNIAGVGWLGLVIPERHGGTGQSLVDLGILMEEVGRGLLPGPFFHTVMCTLVLLQAANENQKKEFLPRIARGDLIATPAIIEPYSELGAEGIQLQAKQRRGDWVLDGTKLFVENADAADYFVVPGRTRRGAGPERGITLFWVDAKSPGITVERLKTVANDNQCEVQFRDVVVSPSNVLGEVGQGWPALKSLLQKGTALRCCQMVGALQEVLDMSVEYVKFRVVFGRPLGSFQAVQHYCALMATDVDASRFTTYQALWRISEGLLSDLELGAAKAWVSDATQRVTNMAHQCHGAIGFTREHDLQLFTRRLRVWQVSFGDGDYHRKRVAQALNFPPSTAFV